MILVGYAASELVSLFSDYGYNALIEPCSYGGTDNSKCDNDRSPMADHIAHGHMPVLSLLYIADPRLGSKKSETMIRPVQPADYDAILSLEALSFTSAFDKAHLRHLIAQPRGLAFVAEFAAEKDQPIAAFLRVYYRADYCQ